MLPGERQPRWSTLPALCRRKVAVMGLARNDGSDKSSSRLSDRIGQFVAIPSRFVTESSGLSVHSRWLLVTLRFFCNGQTDTAFPSYTALCRVGGLRREMVSRGLRELEAHGWLERRKRPNKVNVYILKLPREPKQKLIERVSAADRSSEVASSSKTKHRRLSPEEVEAGGVEF